MVERKVGTVIRRQTLSPILSLFRLMPQPGSRFPEYKPGQYIALRRDDCKLTQRVVDAN
jgi:ferredoxin-NADP reductase